MDSPGDERTATSISGAIKAGGATDGFALGEERGRGEGLKKKKKKGPET